MRDRPLLKTLLLVASIAGGSFCEKSAFAQTPQEIAEWVSDIQYDSTRRLEAFQDLIQAAPGSPNAREALISLTQNPQPEISSRAIEALGPFAKNHGEVREALVALAGHRQPFIRREVAAALGPAAENHADARESLIHLAENRNFMYRDWATRSLRAAAQNHTDARGALIKLVLDPHPATRSNAAYALGPAAQNHPEARKALIASARDSRHEQRSIVAQELELAAQNHADAREALLTLAGDPDWRVARDANNTIGHLIARLSSFPLEQRQAIAADFFNFAALNSVERKLATAIDKMLAELARLDPGLRLTLLRNSAGLDLSLRVRAFTHSRERAQAVAIRALERVYGTANASPRPQAGITVIRRDSAYRDVPREPSFRETPEIEAFLAERGRNSRIDPQERALHERVSIYLASAGQACSSVEGAVRALSR